MAMTFPEKILLLTGYQRLVILVYFSLLCSCLPVVRSQNDVELDSCYKALFSADTDADRRVDSEEYVTFLQSYRPERLPDSVELFTDLPLSLKSSFYSLACSCRDDESQPDDCCIGDNAHLPNLGTGSTEAPTAAQQTRLFTICFFSQLNLDRLPTENPKTVFPSIRATTSPTSTPTRVPSPSPSAGSTFPLTSQPTSRPTTTVTTIPTPTDSTSLPSSSAVEVSYNIVVSNAALNATGYEADLVIAMDDLAVTVAAEVDTGRRRSLKPHIRRRFLQDGTIQVQLPTSIDELVNLGFTMTPFTDKIGRYTGLGPCPADLGNPTTDHCQRVTAEIELVLSPGEAGLAKKDEFRKTLERAVVEGRLQQSIETLRPSSIATIVTGQVTSLSEDSAETDPPSAIKDDATQRSPISLDDDNNTKINGGATAGIVVGAFAVAGVLGFLLVRQRSGINVNQKQIYSQQPEQVQGGDTGSGDRKLCHEISSPKSTESSVSVMSHSHKLAPSEEISEGGRRVTISKSSSSIGATIVENDDSDMPRERNSKTTDHNSPKKDSGSAASESGWSSDDVCNSSMGTYAEDDRDSLDDDDDCAVQMGPKMIDLAAVEGSLHNSDADCSSGQEGVKLSALQAAIMVGDWAAVGSSAAALASSNYDSESDRREDPSTDAASSNMSQSRAEEWKSRDTAGSWQMAMDISKETELEQLIEQGNWEAVIQAAAKFEAEQHFGSTGASEDSSLLGGEECIADNGPGNTVVGGIPSKSVTSPVANHNESTASIRSDVMDLIQKVVPEELDNVDEMLTQFQGREEDLIETLKTMELRHKTQQSLSSEKRGGNGSGADEERQS